MKKTDYLWQYFIDQEKQCLMSRPVSELLAMDYFTDQSGTIQYGIWHETPELRNDDVHSFILMTTRNVFLGLERKYISGFSIDKMGAIIPISDDVLYSYD